MKSTSNLLEDAQVRAQIEHAVLDASAAPQFDGIISLVKLTFDVPVAVIALVEDDRHWFQARYGADLPPILDDSLCSHVGDTRKPLVIEDVYDDPRFADHPMMVGGKVVRTYVGVPLEGTRGALVGTLCAIDFQPRAITERQVEAMVLLSRQVVSLLELRRTGQLLRDERRSLAEREAELADRERRLSTVFESMSEGVVVQDRTGRVIHHNAAAERILGLARAELAGRSSTDPQWQATHPDGRPFPGSDHPSMTTLRTGKPASDVVMCLHVSPAEQRWISISSRPLIRPGDEAPYAVLSTFRDITEEREIADRLARHQRLVTIGTLAAGVGHEINNPMTYVLTNLEIAIEELAVLGGDGSSSRLTEIVALLRQANEGGERIRQIVRGLKSLAREGSEAVPLDVHAVIRNAVQASSHELRTQATVTLELGDVPRVNADESRLVQVMINLLVNAAEAFSSPDPLRNQIIVRTSHNRDVVIEVIDNGPGIAADLLPRIFDPFFTTKQSIGRAGLGLSIAHGVIASLGGELRCETRQGEGTTFRLSLPAVVVEAPASTAVVARVRGRALVIDDERPILQSIARALQADFDVVGIDDPREALRRLLAGEQFDLIFCDVAMPFLSGPQVFEQLIAQRPELASSVVFISGNMGDDLGRAFLARVPNERLEKPFTLQNLRGLARRYLPKPT